MTEKENINISVNEIYDITVHEINSFLDKYAFIFELVALIVAAISLYYFFRGLYVYKRRSINSKIFIIYSAAVFANSLGAAAVAYMGESAPPIISFIATSALLCLPAIMCLHTWSQVHYKPITAFIAILYFAVPIIVTLFNAYRLIIGQYQDDVWGTLCFSSISLKALLFLVYWLAMIVKCLSLCFNVFYQMPKHMRGSTMMIITARIILAVSVLLALLIGTKSAYLIVLLALVIVLNRLFRGFFRANASNVIATSRQFVFSNLSTMILVLSLKGRILEWNRPDGESIYTFVKPKYLQPFVEYKEKLLLKGEGVVSPHDENIITITIEDKELNLMITTKPITEGDKEYGTLVEISEITSIYSILRVMESIAELDHMTGLFNRNAYMNMAVKYMNNEYMPLLIIIGDVNNLKTVNDTYSHLSGDRLLCCVSEIVSKQAPQNSFVARIGGDEIVLLVPGGTIEIAHGFAQRVFSSMKEINDQEFGTPSISLGWSIVNSASEDYNEVFARADEMMYEQKRAFKAGQPITLAGSVRTKTEENNVTEDSNLEEL